MKRLTKLIKGNKFELKEKIDFSYFAPALGKVISEAINRLGIYELKDDAGLIIELPVAIGDSLMVRINDMECNAIVEEIRVTKKDCFIIADINGKKILYPMKSRKTKE